MTATITTVAELNALPVKTVLLDSGLYPVWKTFVMGWCASNGTDEIEPYLLIRDGAPLTVIYRPDQPQRTEAQIKAEALRDAAETAEDALSESEHQQWDYDWICYLRETADRLESEARP